LHAGSISADSHLYTLLIFFLNAFFLKLRTLKKTYNQQSSLFEKKTLRYLALLLSLSILPKMVKKANTIPTSANKKETTSL